MYVLSFLLPPSPSVDKSKTAPFLLSDEIFLSTTSEGGSIWTAPDGISFRFHLGPRFPTDKRPTSPRRQLRPLRLLHSAKTLLAPQIWEPINCYAISLNNQSTFYALSCLPWCKFIKFKCVHQSLIIAMHHKAVIKQISLWEAFNFPFCSWTYGLRALALFMNENNWNWLEKPFGPLFCCWCNNQLLRTLGRF